MEGLTGAWELARGMVQKAQAKQKKQYDQHAREEVSFKKGDRVFVHMPGKKRGKAHKFSCPFQGPYGITSIWETGAEVVLVDKPQAGAIQVALNRL